MNLLKFDDRYVRITTKAGEIFDFFLGHADYLQLLNEQGLGYGPFSLED